MEVFLSGEDLLLWLSTLHMPHVRLHLHGGGTSSLMQARCETDLIGSSLVWLVLSGVPALLNDLGTSGSGQVTSLSSLGQTDRMLSYRYHCR